MNCLGAVVSHKSNNLATPEPHYIPGYLGYLPQEKFRPGHTYGMTSHRVLLDPCIHMSPRSMLTNIHPEHCTDDFGRPGLGADPFMHSQMALVNSRVNSFGRQQYQPNMTPGYTGFVPRFQTILGHTYSPACNRALARFEQDQWRDRLFNKELEALDGWRFCYKTKPWETPENIRPDVGDLQEFARDPCRGNMLSQQSRLTPAISPVLPSKVNWAGLEAPTGCRASGKVQPSCNYGERRTWESGADKLCGFSNKFCKPVERVQQIYRGCEGMIPRYNGHVPGEQFRIGKTYGTTTRSAKTSRDENSCASGGST